MYKQAILSSLVKIAEGDLSQPIYFRETPDDYDITPWKYRNANTIGTGVGAVGGGLVGAGLGAGAGYLINKSRQKAYNKRLADINNDSKLDASTKAKMIKALRSPSKGRSILLGAGIGAGVGALGGGYIGNRIGTSIKNKHGIDVNPKYYMNPHEGLAVSTRLYKDDYNGTDAMMHNLQLGNADHPGPSFARNGDEISINLPSQGGRVDRVGRGITDTFHIKKKISDLTPDEVNKIMGVVANSYQVNDSGHIASKEFAINKPIVTNEELEPLNIYADSKDLTPEQRTARDTAYQKMYNNMLNSVGDYKYTPTGTAWRNARSTGGYNTMKDDYLASVHDMLTNKDTTSAVIGGGSGLRDGAAIPNIKNMMIISPYDANKEVTTF